MDIDYKPKRLQKLLVEQKQLVKEYGDRRAKLIAKRMKALRAAESLQDLAPPLSGPERCHELTGGKLRGQISVDLDYPYRLLFIPNHNPLPQRPEGGLSWSEVTAITIIGVKDTHG